MIIKKRHLFDLMGAEMSRSNCSVWIADSLQQQQQQQQQQPEEVDVASLDLIWSWYALLETSTLNVFPGLCVAVLMSYNISMVNEIMVWLAELRLQLVATLVVVGFKLHNPLDKAADINLAGDSKQLSLRIQHCNLTTRYIYNVHCLRQRFTNETWFFLIPAFCRLRIADTTRSTRSMEAKQQPGKMYTSYFANSKALDRAREFELTKQILEANSQSHGQDHARKRSDRDDDLNNCIETMQNIYVNFRMFIEHIHQTAPANAVLFSMIYVLNYGLAVIGVIMSRKLRNLRGEPMFFIVFGLTLANILIATSANFHANAKKLQPILWSIIARMTHSSDMRIKHLRFLWFKQVQKLDDKGGLALSAFSIRITHINILQLAIWTATIIIIAVH
jgi:hypothetical protein